jgi:TonB-dependent SusC/RagA subfamily outer membrane receptor
VGILWAQQKNIRGKVTNEDGNPIEGVTIKIKGHLNALAQTSETGEYSIDANTGDVLLFASMGFANAERRISDQNMINVIMTADLTNLDEVVVVGYGTQKKVNLTGAVSTINSEQLERRPVVSTSTALQGLAPGVTVTSQSGAPGGDQGSIRIRGVNSFGGSDSEPLVIIDGVAGSLDNIDANLIESISVLKDAASASIYGSRAANGVILVTTKEAKTNLESIIKVIQAGKPLLLYQK